MNLIKYSSTLEPYQCPNCESSEIEHDDNTFICQNCDEVFSAPEEHFYLNHAYLSTCAFGSLDMAWSTDDREKADLMLYKVRDKHPHLANIEIEEY